MRTGNESMLSDPEDWGSIIMVNWKELRAIHDRYKDIWLWQEELDQEQITIFAIF